MEEKNRLLIIKDVEHYDNLKTKTHSILDKLYRNKYSPRKVVGSCTYLYDVLKPTSYQDFLDKYIGYYNGDEKNEYRGRSLDELTALAEQFQKDALENHGDKEVITQMTFEDFYDLLIMHIIVETYDGHRAEEYYKNMYEEQGYKVTTLTEQDDTVFGIDFIIESSASKHFIQVKPRTFATSRSSTYKDRANHFRKEQKIKEKYGENSKLEFIFYEKGENKADIKTYMVNESGKIRFRLSDVCYENGYAKYPSKKDFQDKFKFLE